MMRMRRMRIDSEPPLEARARPRAGARRRPLGAAAGGLAATAFLLLALPGCSTNPATGAREVVIMSADREKAVSEQASQQVAAQMGLVRDETLTAYVQSIGKRLAALSPRQDVAYEFHVVDLPEANAFALPGGHIYVSRGLLALANSEDELANVIGHEIGHVAARHAAQRETRATGVGVLTTLGTIAAAVAGSGEAAQAIGQLGQLAGAGVMASYGREQEREADRIGQEIAARGGWNPRGMTVFLRTLGRDTELRTGKRERPGFLDDHPTTPERVEVSGAFARTLQVGSPAPIAASRPEFLARIEGVQIGEDPKAGVFRGETFLHPDLDLHVDLPDGWQMRNEPAAVGGISSNGAAFIKIEGDGQGTDVVAAADAFLEKAGFARARRLRVRAGAERAYQALANDGQRALEFTWIPHRGQIYRVTSACPAQSYSAYKRLFERTIQSFRPLTADERRSIQSRTLYTAQARAGETLAELSQRTRNAWSVDETAVANGIFAYDRLTAGQFVKIAVDRVYEPAPAPVPAPGNEPPAASAVAEPRASLP
jgi:predicted Zn-dependent protease